MSPVAARPTSRSFPDWPQRCNSSPEGEASQGRSTVLHADISTMYPVCQVRISIRAPGNSSEWSRNMETAAPQRQVCRALCAAANAERLRGEIPARLSGSNRQQCYCVGQAPPIAMATACGYSHPHALNKLFAKASAK